jgi:5-methylcytosine-specific restriction endonuclease McrA
VTDVLVLNASYEPLRIVPVRRAVVLLLQQKAELIEATAQRLRAQGMAFAVPLVVRLVRYVAIPRHRRLPCSRRGVLARDRETCQYCGAQPGRAHLTLDHVLPRAQGGTTAWENVVAACAACNHRKANRTPQQAGMSLVAAPRQPTYAAFALLGVLERHDVWQKYSYRPRDED